MMMVTEKVIVNDKDGDGEDRIYAVVMVIVVTG